MTLKQAILKVANRCRVDLISEVDTANNDLMTAELMSAAREVSRDTYFLFTDHSALTLTACTDGSSAGAVIDLLDTSVSEKPIFHCYGMRVNGVWLYEWEWSSFVADDRGFPNYWTDTASAHPSIYVPESPSKSRLYPPPNSTAAAASNFAIGFYLHDQYTYQANQDTELLGPKEFHDLIVNRCALNISEAYISGENASRRFALLTSHYEQKSAEYRDFNLSTYKKAVPKGAIGRTRRIVNLA